MRAVAVLTAIVAVFGVTVVGQTKDAQSKTKPAKCSDAGKGIVYYRARVWESQRILNESRIPTNHAEKKASCTYKKWAAQLWHDRAVKYRRILVRLNDAKSAICYIFGRYCNEAITVAHCESRLSRHAHNGQYLGLFQMGNFARSTYGHGDTFVEQARAAHRYFVASGKDWSPWSCKPW